MPSLQSLLDQVDDATNEIVEFHRSLVRIPTVNTGFMPTGDETKVAEHVKDWLSGEGIGSEILSRDEGRGNIISVLPGADHEKTRLMFMSHTDVVPIEDWDKWRFEPFSAEISGGRIYGRGASDCKALLASQLMAMAILKRNDVVLSHGLRLVSGADEEHGGRWGFGWLAEVHPETLESEFAVNEGGGTPVETGNTLTYLLGTGEKGRLEVHIRFKGVSAHASVAWTGTNSSYALARALSSIESYEPELDTSLDIFNHLGTFAIEDRATPANIDSIVEQANKANPRLGTILRALSRLTLTPTMISGGIKSNSVPEVFELTCDVRTLPFQDEAYVRSQLDKVLDGIPDVEYDIDYMSVPNESPFETELAEAIKRAQALAVERDDIQWVPAVSNGFTDSRFTRNLGIVTYGFSGVHPDDDPTLSKAHGTDESVG
ncbi:MAG: M20/M25/M40 family metallo-hydrolase, partial [Chloroflexi bacterium]|nr:M20/M25/M40 family metallo-hydrolase [Chloroflexota bacterium]